MSLILALLLAADAPAGVPAPVLARPVERGDILSESDFVEEARPAAQAAAALAPAAVAGMEAKRRLAPGAIVRAHDVMTARLVRRGEPVTLRVKSGALTITTQGRALSDGRRGDLVRVVTSGTSRTLDGVVDGAGAVRIAAF